MDRVALFDELTRLGVVSDDMMLQLKEAGVLDKYEGKITSAKEKAHESFGHLKEKTRKGLHSMGRLGRYALVGATVGPAIGAAGDLIGHRPILGGKGNRLRTLAAQMTTGALGASVIPIARKSLDQQARLSKEKTAKLKTQLLPHQQRVVDRIQQPDQPGLLVVHGLGSGKTLTSIGAQEGLGMPSQVVAPAALLENYAKERRKHLEGHSQPADLVSMQNMATKGKPPDAPLMIVDEAHRARDPSSATFQTLKGNTAQKRLLMTGSPFYNHPSDIAPLINLAADQKVLPYEKDDFSRRYISEKVVKPSLGQRFLNNFREDENKVKPGVVPILYEKMAPELKQNFAKWVDYYPGSKENFPEVTRQDVNVPMSKEQLRIYDTLMDQAPAWVAAKVKRGLPPSKQEASQLNAFLGAARQATNTTAPFIQEGTPEDPKLQTAFEHLQKSLGENPRSKAVVYSNYLDAGINPYKARLDAAGIPYGEFTGEMNRQKRDQLVRDYNENKIRTLLLSSAGGEGLDLKGTRLMQILEPHWNTEKLKQVEGRGARFKSHEGLPPEEQKLLIERYLAQRPQGTISKLYHSVTGKPADKSVDEYLAQMSGDKEKLIEQFRALLPQHTEPATPAQPAQPMKTAATRPPTEASRELEQSWKPRIAAEAAYSLPLAISGASFGSLPGRMAHDPRVALGGAALGAGLMGYAGHLVSNHEVANLTKGGKTLARQALKNPGRENYLRDQGGKLDWLDIGKGIATRQVMGAPFTAMNAMMSGGSPLPPIAASVAADIPGSIGKAYLEKYKRMIALNELENVRAEEGERDAEKLHRLRREVNRLETRVEGDGWKKPPESEEVEAPAAPKDRSGKSW